MEYQYTYEDDNKFSLFCFIISLIIVSVIFLGIPFAIYSYNRNHNLQDCEIVLNDGTKKIYRTYNSYSVNGFYCIRKDMDIKFFAPYEYIKIPLTNIKNVDIHYINK